MSQYKNIINYLWVRDMHRSNEFYTKVLGLNEVFSAEGWVELSVPGVPGFQIALNRWQKDAVMPINEFITFGVDDLDAFYKHLVSEDAHMKGEIVEFTDEGLRFFKFQDPDDNILTAAENK